MAKLNHIGIAVQNRPELQKLLDVLGVPFDHSESVPEQGVDVHFHPIPQEVGSPTQIELLEPVDPQGAVAQFIKKRGPGIHHLAFEVEKGELESLCTRLRQEGYRLIYDDIQKGAHGMRINFIHPASAGGILVEILEKGS